MCLYLKVSPKAIKITSYMVMLRAHSQEQTTQICNTVGKYFIVNVVGYIKFYLRAFAVIRNFKMRLTIK